MNVYRWTFVTLERAWGFRDGLTLRALPQDYCHFPREQFGPWPAGALPPRPYVIYAHDEHGGAGDVCPLCGAGAAGRAELRRLRRRANEFDRGVCPDGPRDWRPAQGVDRVLDIDWDAPPERDTE